MKENQMTKSEFAQKMGVSKGYISQILNGDFDHKLSKFIELSLMINKVPLLRLEDIDKVLLLDKEKKLNEPESSAIGITQNYNLDVEHEKNEPGWVVNDSDDES